MRYRSRSNWVALQEGFVFFFFFFWPSSDDFESEEFKRFCSACYRVRAFKPNLTVNGLYAVLSVAASYPQRVSYEAFTQATGQVYNSAAIQAAQLSEGHGKRVGLRLLRRVAGADRKQKMLELSRTGRAVACLFCDVSEYADQDCAEYLSSTILPVFGMVRREAPSLTLGTFCVLLAVTQNLERFGAWGDPSGIIADKLGVSNLPKHFEHLGSGSEKRLGLGLVELQRHAQNRRIVLPKLTDNGLRLVANIAAGLQHKSPSLVRYPKEDKLRASPSPGDLQVFSDDDFDFDEVEWLRPGDDAPISPGEDG